MVENIEQFIGKLFLFGTFKLEKNIIVSVQVFQASPDHLTKLKMSRLRFGRDRDGYSKVPTDDSGFSDAQFEAPPPKIPWKAISLATFLLIVGTVLLIVGSLIVTGHIDTKYSDRLWPMIVLGGIMFLPGAYHIRIAYYAFKEYPGYSFSDIPEFE